MVSYPSEMQHLCGGDTMLSLSAGALRKAGPSVPGWCNMTFGGNVMFLEPVFIEQHRARVKQVTVGCGTHQGQETYRRALAILRLIKVRLEISVPNFYLTKAGSLA